MSDDDKKPTIEEMRAKILASKRAQGEDLERARVEREYARLELAERLEKETGGKENVQFAIYDASGVGEGLFAVKLGPSIVYQTYWESQRTAVDRCDFVTHCIAHPSKEEYLAARNRRPGLDYELANRLARLYGLDIEIQEGK